MLTVENIAESVRQAATQYPLKKIELFSAYALETNGEKSDIDLEAKLANNKRQKRTATIINIGERIKNLTAATCLAHRHILGKAVADFRDLAAYKFPTLNFPFGITQPTPLLNEFAR